MVGTVGVGSRSVSLQWGSCRRNRWCHVQCLLRVVSMPVAFSRAGWAWGQWGCAVIRAVRGLFLTVRLMETDPSCVIPLDSAADLVCIDSGSANAQMRGPSDGNRW